MSRSLWFGNILQLDLESRFTTVQCSLLSMFDLIWAISPKHTKVRICSEPSRRNSEYFRRRAVFQKQFFLGEKRVSDSIKLPGTCGNGNDNFRIFTISHIFPRGDQRWIVFLEPIQLCFDQRLAFTFCRKEKRTQI